MGTERLRIFGLLLEQISGSVGNLWWFLLEWGKQNVHINTILRDCEHTRSQRILSRPSWNDYLTFQ